MTGRVIRETRRLIIRELTEDDLDVYYRLGSLPEVMRYIGPLLSSREQALHILRTVPLAEYQRHGYARWACVLRETGEMIGWAGPKLLPDLGETDLGYWLLPEFWGQGFASEAARAVAEEAFGPLQLPRLVATVHPENLASQRVLEKIGMQLQGIIDYQGKPTRYYVMTPADFPQQNQPA